MKHEFDDAIKHLKAWNVNRMYDSSIRILEAAEGFASDEKNRLRGCIKLGIAEYEPSCGISICPGKRLKDRAIKLIEALPETEKEP